MERSVAIKKLGKLIGKGLGYRVNTKAPTKEEREAARAEYAVVVKERNELQEKKRARYNAIIAADVEYQTLLAAHEVASAHANKLLGRMHSAKITVGDTSNGMFFVVKAEGDSWEEVINKIETKKEIVR